MTFLAKTRSNALAVPTARILTALAAGAIFGFGLSLSGMLDPVRVRGFLDVAGDFDPSLGFVLAGAVAVSGASYLISRRFRRPALEAAFHLPTRRDIDFPLVAGSAIFGVGWGIGGICPGPATSLLAFGLAPAFVFAAMMLFGVIIHDAAAPIPKAPPRRRADAQV
jgi:hypothetical protein